MSTYLFPLLTSSLLAQLQKTGMNALTFLWHQE